MSRLLFCCDAGTCLESIRLLAQAAQWAAPVLTRDNVMTFDFRQMRRVQFAETDLAGIVHFSNFFRYMEETEHAFYRSLGFSVHDMPGDSEGSRVGWPRVHASCDYKLPLRFEEEFVVHLVIEEVREKTIVYQAGFLRTAGEGEELAALGRMIVVCVGFGDGGSMRSVRIPAGLRERIAAAPPEALFLRNTEGQPASA